MKKIKNVKDVSVSLVDVYWVAAAVPLVTLLVAFLLGGWSWGLMDDVGFAAMQGSIWTRFVDLFQGQLGSGRFFPTAGFHWAVFYKIFASSPGAFFVFRFFEVVCALGVWAFLAYRVTGRRSAAPLFFAIVLSFSEVYHAFFYLSPPEIIGILFAGLAANAFFQTIRTAVAEKGAVKKTSVLLGMIFLVLAFGAKEPFIAMGLALGAGYMAFGRSIGKNSFFYGGIALAAFALLWGVALKLFIMKGYSSDYGLTDIPKLLANLAMWGRTDFLYHLPWLVLAGILIAMSPPKGKQDPVRTWGLWLGGALYVFYLLLLLPWSVWGHYAVPVGFFFGFFMTVLIAERLETLPWPAWSLVVTGSLIFCAVVGGMALRFHSTYQRDTAQLVEWMAQDALFEHEVEGGAVVRCNASEPCETVPAKARILYGKNYKPFVFTAVVRDILSDPQTRYYLWGRTWGDQDLRRLGHDLWSPMFVSESWVMFRRMY